MKIDPASYRDPAGFVFTVDGEIYRTITAPAAEHWQFLNETGALRRLVDQGLLLSAEEVTPPEGCDGFAHVVRHPRLAFVSYPYEWPFAALQQAALLHLDLHLACLDEGVTLIDGSAYNVQFQGARPVFIDLLSLRRYHEGEYWIGHRQFCEQFLNPLLLQAALGVSPAAWYRGAMEGIPGDALMRLLPRRWWLRRGVLQHVVLPHLLSGRSLTRGAAPPLPRTALMAMLRGLRHAIAGLRAKPTGGRWTGYATENVYGDGDYARKRAFVAAAVRRVAPAMLWDVGCNSGDAAVTALEAGAGTVIGFDSDPDVLNQAYERACREQRSFLPLLVDMANPSPDGGWNQQERTGIAGRRCADMVTALAVLHHLVIGRNLPLERVVDWLIDLAPAGVVEFVPHGDPMIEGMLRWRDKSQFAGYTPEALRARLGQRAEIVDELILPHCGRHLLFYERRA